MNSFSDGFCGYNMANESAEAPQNGKTAPSAHWVLLNHREKDLLKCLRKLSDSDWNKVMEYVQTLFSAEYNQRAALLLKCFECMAPEIQDKLLGVAANSTGGVLLRNPRQKVLEREIEEGVRLFRIKGAVPCFSMIDRRQSSEGSLAASDSQSTKFCSW